MVEEKQMILCSECGNKLSSTAKFCKNCGAKVDLENVKIVEETETDGVEEIDPGEEVVENVTSEQVANSPSIDFDHLLNYFFSYLDFLKETLVKPSRSEEHTSELQSRFDLVCRLLLAQKK